MRIRRFDDRRCPRAIVPAALLIAALAASAARAQPPATGSIVDGAWSPGPLEGRMGHTAVFDPIVGRLLVFGGVGNGVGSQVWEFTVLGVPSAARQLDVQGTPPSPRSGHVALFDSLGNRMLIFGGDDGSLRNDVWALSLAGTPAWTQLAPSGTPPSPRRGHAAAYDPVGHRLIVIGGDDGSLRNDAWALSLAGPPAWTNLAPTGTPPSGRWRHSAAYDSAGQRVLVFGGNDGSRRQDLWALSLIGSPSWVLLGPNGAPPAARDGHVAIVDRTRRLMFVQGGDIGAPTPDVWSLTLDEETVGLNWQQYLPPGTAPTGRTQHAAVFDSWNNRMMLVGGQDGAGPRGDLWSFGPNAQQVWVWAPLLAPAPREDAAVLFDPARRRMLMFGGFTTETWELSLDESVGWTRLLPLSPPPVRSGATAVLDALNRRMVLFGGTGTANYRNDVWFLPLDGGDWTSAGTLDPVPGGRANHGAIYDPIGQRMIVFGGYNSTIYLNDVWALSLAGAPAWTQLAPLGTPPSVRSGLTAIHDPDGQRMLVFGGFSGSVRNDLWALSLAGTPEWIQLAPLGTPPSPRREHAAVYDSLRNRMLVFGGRTTGRLNDLWQLSLGDLTWTPLAPLGSLPPARQGHAAVFDPITDRLAVFGGSNGATVYGDTWLAHFDHATPVTLSLVSADADPGSVRVAWQAGGAFGWLAAVERREPAGEWAEVAEVAADAGRLTYEDTAVEPGRRYGYRLAWSEGGQRVTAGEVWVEVPRGLALALRGARPNPAEAELRVSFTLASDSPATLELLDVTGRRVLALDVGERGAGSHVATLGGGASGGARLAAGVYVLRLTQEGRTVTAKAAVVR
jgi:hypothetical protein